MVNRFLLILLLLAPVCAGAAKLQDPMRPLGYQVPAAKQQPAGEAEKKQREWRLGAVLIAADRSVAVINGQSLQLGEKLEGFKLIKVEPDSATLQRKNKKIVLHRAGTGLKKAFLSRDVGEGSQP
ncbi:hypothetical protein SAMN02745165_03174 [Malonomonas rubra DSM 5091]|uniref:MSHA biogenesis protein MshK n=1 Tax=Malonomonas rubra DSM 5091 TaxID=1122189 RepID=A0A1M6M5R4_MALRU|nr:hypothetical protein [Malonomonas rubra]SHJ78768.1 hypothetical protein SAMN02745165_03174 [Malonomonas rubra DSM 5091]